MGDLLVVLLVVAVAVASCEQQLCGSPTILGSSEQIIAAVVSKSSQSHIVSHCVEPESLPNPLS